VTLAPDVKAQVRAFYDSVGWAQVGESAYQNARYEDLRPVSREYIHRCHLRVARHLPARGDRVLDAGSGPIQYPEYLTYSEGYRHRVCLDISRRALVEARQRIGDHGRFVVGDIAALPFAAGVFDGAACLHTIHHLAESEQPVAFGEMVRVLVPGGRGVAVYSWGNHSPLMRLARIPIGLAFGLLRLYRRLRFGREANGDSETSETAAPTGTYTHNLGYRELRGKLGSMPGLDVRVWRTVSTSFLRALVHRRLGGAFWLRNLYALEERFPRALGRLGQYAMILFAGPSAEGVPEKRAAR
jgi:SAM-dependent methyltransferase